MDTVKDYITGKRVPNVGAEANRQSVERVLVDQKGYDRAEVVVDRKVRVPVAGAVYTTRVDLIVQLDDWTAMVIVCAAGSLGSWQRQVLAAARLINADYQVPLAVVSDGKRALVQDTVTGTDVGSGLAAIPDRREMLDRWMVRPRTPLPLERREREALIFRSYDSMRVNKG